MEVMAKTDQSVGVCRMVYKMELAGSSMAINVDGSIDIDWPIDVPGFIVFIDVGSHGGEERASFRDERNAAAADDDDEGGAKAQTAVSLVAASKEQHTAAAAAMKR
eukprot:scaffold489_cov80-Skeletonema_menzelii.AAC.2